MKNVKDQSHWLGVTMTIQNEMTHWPGDLPVKIWRTSDKKDGDNANVTYLSFSAHTGTHVDAPRHFIADGKDVSQMSLENLIGPAKVFQIQHQNVITLDEIQTLDINAGDRILFKTRNSEKNWTLLPFQRDFVFLATDAARYLRDQGVICVGVDYLSVGGKENGAEVHETLLSKEIAIIEGLNLHDAMPGMYSMICLPLRIMGADGSPARVLLQPIKI